MGKERQTVFFTAVNPMNKEHKDPYEIEKNAPRLAWYKQKKWKRHQDTVYWVDIQLAQRKGFKFYQTKSNAIILYDTLPAYCIPKVVVMEYVEILHEKVYASLRPPSKISFKDNWMKELDSEVSGGTEDSQQIQPKSKTQISRTERATIWFAYSGDQKRCLVWLRKDKLKNGETCEWTTSQPELCASVC